MKAKATDRHLAAMWSPPDKIPTGKSAGRPILCVASTYTFNADFLESDLLPRFLGLKFDDSEGDRPFIIEREEALASCRVSLLVDASQADSSQTTLRWDQIPIFVPGGVQHAKVTLLVWESFVRLIVASANITRNGYRKNREIAASLDFFNHPDSTPREVIYDALSFMHDMTSWARADETVLNRLRDQLRTVRNLLGQWRSAPDSFSERERPRVAFMAGYPAREGAASSSVLRKVLQLWGNSSASDITVLTPFLGQPDSNYSELINALRTIPLSRNATGSLVLPRRMEIEDDDKIPRIGLPKRFLDDWAQAWRVDPSDVLVYGVPPLRKETEEKLMRDLHAKSILISNDTNTLLMCGSSNFSAHGMGIRAFNIEANLVYIDSTTNYLGKIALRDRLPVEWDMDQVIKAVWDDDGVRYTDDEAPTEPQLPAVFQSATFRQTDSIVSLGFNARQTFPSKWEIRIPGERQDKDLIILTGADIGATVPAKHEVKLPVHLQKVHLTNLRVIWIDGGKIERTARLLVHVLKYEDLLPPPEFAMLTVSGIIDCLISGRELSDITNETERRPEQMPTRDLQAPKQDTSDYLLYRMRRLGYALGVLGERILKAARTNDAISYRLLYDPLGPVQLAEALTREYKIRLSTEGETEALLFALHEIVLVVAHAGARCHTTREAGEPDFRDFFKLCTQKLKEIAELTIGLSDADDKVQKYGIKVFRVTQQLLGS